MWRRPAGILGMAVVGLVLGFPTGLEAQTSAPVAFEPTTVDGRLRFPVGHAEGEIRIDGSLDDVGWTNSIRIPLPYEVSPGDNTPAESGTECRVMHDASALYFGCTATDDDPASIRAYVTDRDQLNGQDRVSLVIDPFNDSRRAFEFEVNPLGVQADALIRDGMMSVDASWDAIWDAAGRITARGYVVEAAIPFQSLRFPSASGPQTWGFYLKRMRPRSERTELRSMTVDRDDSCALCQANLLDGIQGVVPGVNMEVVPTATASRTDVRPAEGPSLQGGAVDWDPGVSARWSITTDLALNATINPDFSQIEADAPQLDVNNRFALFFPERRPFFLEGADLFQTPLQAVFTRTIADPIAGGKLTGKAGANAVGLLVARDEVTNILIPGAFGSSATSLDANLTSTIARYRRDVGASSTVGGLYTGRFGTGYRNQVYGVDANVRPTRSLRVEAQVIRSDTEYPAEVARDFSQDSTAFGGTATRLGVFWNTRNWQVGLNARSIGRGFRADAGFMNQANARGGWGWIGRSFWGDDASWFTRIQIQPGGWYTGTQDGALVDRGTWIWFNYQGPLQTNIWFNPDWAQETFQGETYTFRRLWGGGSFQPFGSFRLGFNGNVGGAVDFANAREAHEVRISPNMGIRIGRNVDLNLSYTLQRLTAADETIFSANVSQLRAIYNFSPRAFVRGTFQFRRTVRNPDQFTAQVDREQNALFSQLLFSYKLNPLTVVFLGYADNRAGLETFDRRTEPFVAEDRTFFLKIGYAWRP